MALQPIRPVGPIAPKVTRPTQSPTGPVAPAPTTTLPSDPIERNKILRSQTGTADTQSRKIDYLLEEERLRAAEGRAKELGIDVPKGAGTEPVAVGPTVPAYDFTKSPYYKRTNAAGQIIFTSPSTGKEVFYNPETGMVPGMEQYGITREYVMDNLPQDPIERNKVIKWLDESKDGKIDLSEIGVRSRGLSEWARLLTNPLALLSAPGRVVVSSIEEITDIPSGQASFSDINKAILDPSYGFGTFTGDITGNKWLDRAIGLVGDIATDPTNYLLPGGSQIADVAVSGASRVAAKDAARLFTAGVIRDGAPEALRALGVTDNVIEALSKSWTDIIQSKGLVTDALKIGDEAALSAARAAEEAAQASFNKAASEIAKVAKIGRNGVVRSGTTRAGRIIAAEAERAAAFADKQMTKAALDMAIAGGDNTAISAARYAFQDASKKLDDATEALVSIGNVKGVPVRKYGEQARLALAQRVKQVRARAILDAENQALDYETRISAAAVAEVLTDENIAKIAQNGWSAIRGELADALGAKGGIRFGFSKASKRIPGSGTISDTIGETVSRGRNKLQSIFGDKFISAVTPVAKSGPVDPETILQMRTALRTGKAGTDAVNFLNIIAFNDAVVRARSLANSRANIILNKILKKGDSRIADSIVQYLTVPQEEWAIRGLATPSAAQLDLINRVRGTMDAWYEEANSLHRALGNAEDLPRVENYFPLVQTDVFSAWSARNPVQAVRVGQAVEPTVVDPTWIATNFMERELVPGKVWFGHTLTVEDLDGGPARLNQIARESGVFGNRNINVFEERLAPALNAYANKHARYIAFGRTVLDITNPMSSFLDTFRRSLISKVYGVSSSTFRDIDNLKATIGTLLTPSRLVDWSMDDINEVLNRLYSINDVLYEATLPGGKPVNAQLFKVMLDDVENYVNEITRLIRSGDYPENLIPLAIHELDAMALNAVNEVEEIGLKAITMSPKQWEDVVNVAETGFEVLNFKTIPNITARNEVAELLTNVRKLRDPGVASEMSALAGAYQQWWKSWVLATPRYVRRNALSDSFQILLAGADTKTALKSMRIWRKFLDSGKSIEEFAQTLPTAQRRMFLEAASSIPSSAEIVGRGSPGYVAAKMFGGRPVQTGTGEIGGELIGGAGIFGGPATGRLPILGRYGIGPESKLAAKTSRVLGSPIDFTRTIASNISDMQRFILTYDGLSKGLSLEEAIVRTNKYLIDYGSTSKLDDVVKRSVMPFWMFASRNLPMQYENMLMHPKIFNRYTYVRRFLEASEQDREPYSPLRSRQAGAFQLDPDIARFLGGGGVTDPFSLLGLTLFLPQLVLGSPRLNPLTLGLLQAGQSAEYASETGRPLILTPDFGFPGGGRPNELINLPKEVLNLFGLTGAETGAGTVLSQLPAPLRAFLEIAVNRKFYSKDDLLNEYSKLSPNEQTALYFISQTVPQLSWLGQIPQVRKAVDISQNEALAQALNVPLTFTAIPQGEPGYEDALKRRIKEKAQKQQLSWGGSFVLPFTEQEQISEIARRRRVLEELIRQEERSAQ